MGSDAANLERVWALVVGLRCRGGICLAGVDWVFLNTFGLMGFWVGSVVVTRSANSAVSLDSAAVVIYVSLLVGYWLFK